MELVDIFPTLVDANGLPPLEDCPASGSRLTVTCTEGQSLLPLITTEKPKGPLAQSWKKAVFHQVASMERTSNERTSMAYAVRTSQFR